MVNFIMNLSDIQGGEFNYCGNKAKYLFYMSELKFKIPETLIVYCPKYWNKEIDIQYALTYINDYVVSTFSNKSDIMIRSSFINEDSIDRSFAGKFKTIHIYNQQDIVNAVRNVWASAGEDWVNMGVVIQPYIEAQYSGILFSSLPFDSEKSAVIEFAQGSCDRLVEGNITPDLFTGKHGWVNERPNYVNDVVLCQLLEKMHVLKQKLKCEIDVEFSVIDNQIYFLQCRPITTDNRLRPIYAGESFSGEWVLMQELPYPFTPLIQTMDPSGLFAARPHQFLMNYMYFKSNCPLKESKNDDWINWKDIQDYYMRAFSDISKEIDNSNIQLLDRAIECYRNLVDIYMNVNWFIYRGKAYNDLINALREKYDDYNNIFFDVMRSINTINTRKRQDFYELIQNIDEEPFFSLKERFIKNYGFETSHPFYILCRCLTDYIDEILIIAKERKFKDTFRVTEKPLPDYYSIYDNQICQLIDIYRSVVQRTEDDDYLLCLGSYIIRCILGRISQMLHLNNDDIYFYKYDELKKLYNGESTVCSESELNRRKDSFKTCKNYDMPFKIKNGICIYDQTTQNSIIQGTTISLGRARGVVYVLKNSSDIFEILNIPNGSIIYCSCISPVLSSYFFNIKGIILSENSILSHGAILAREMGIPAIGGIYYNFVSGMMVELDGITGSVHVE